MGDSAYSFSLTTFSRTGKLLQIEYALNAVANGRTSLGICAKDGVVIATDKKLTSELVDVANVHKVELLTPSTGVCYSGVGPDYRVLGTYKGNERSNHMGQFESLETRSDCEKSLDLLLLQTSMRGVIDGTVVSVQQFYEGSHMPSTLC